MSASGAPGPDAAGAGARVAGAAGAGGGGRGFTPPRPPRFTLDQFREIRDFFKEVLQENPLVKWSIVLAGVGGVFEAIHDTWLFLVWLYWKIYCH
jgi:hypothetical protein